MPRLTPRLRHWVCLAFTGLLPIWAVSAQADDAPPSMSAPIITSLSPGAATFFTPVEDSAPQTLPPNAAVEVVVPPAAEATAPWVDDPYGPHNTTGTVAQLGTAVGYVYKNPLDVLAVGGTVAVGRKVGRLTLEGEYGHFDFLSHGSDAITLGNANRYGGVLRVDLLRLGSKFVGPNSMLAIYGEARMGWQSNHWNHLSASDTPRDVPSDSSRAEGSVGFGLLLDHRVEQPRGFPNRIGWLIGWQLVGAPHDPVTMNECKGGPVGCAELVQQPINSTLPHTQYETALLFTSSFQFTW